MCDIRMTDITLTLANNLQIAFPTEGRSISLPRCCHYAKSGWVPTRRVASSGPARPIIFCTFGLSQFSFIQLSTPHLNSTSDDLRKILHGGAQCTCGLQTCRELIACD
eukprot:gnl/MRDRNA2_/MRDRNA2_29491_c0_seq1.p1 gnl/MRDRNA2_/MRDRNA2_29491_c0~~gnl/MRDRNA2_/MRDRNA2_29491_c0_seq1.p1  ORF type:complete len:108 (-),score=4.47 gnl/MRDRNA2_/MRDRNA2_29491_c0_seq1:335-658(-)